MEQIRYLIILITNNSGNVDGKYKEINLIQK